MGAHKFARKTKISLEEAKAHIKKYKDLVNVAIGWLDRTGTQALKQGYAQTLLGRKRFFREPFFPPNERRRWTEFQKYHTDSSGVYTGRFLSLFDFTNSSDDRPNYIKYCRLVDKDDRLGWHKWFDTIPPEWQKYENQIGAMKREGGNTPIQGGNADITKIAMANIRTRLINEGYYPNARICLQVYDEIVIDAPASVRQEARQIQEEEMIRAGERVIRHIPVVVDGELTTHWTK